MSSEAQEKPRVAEAAIPYGTPVADLRSPLILEREGQPVAVILPFDEYERLIQLAASDQERREAAWTSLASLLDDIRQRPTGLMPEQIAAEVT
jgi:PHD/YefM family antitoxin component YafN of YafNO toxin-antitoxin module